MRPDLSFPSSRIQALWNQGPWVAQDEMDYYLTAAELAGNTSMFPPTHFHNEAAAEEEAGVWLYDPILHSTDQEAFAPAAIVNGHWVAMVIQKQGSAVRVTTTPDGSCFIRAATEIANHQGTTLEVIQRILPQLFPADCGFQTFAWIMAIVMQQQPVAISPDHAEGWRRLFAQYLLNSGHQLLMLNGWQICHLVEPSKTLAHKLATFLHENGVWADRVADRTNALLEKLPHASLKSVFSAKKPWNEPKQVANHAKPQIKLIMPDELDAQITARAQHRNQFGRRPAKGQHRKHDQDRSTPVITADNRTVPSGVFKQQDGTVLGPLRADQVGPNAERVVLLDQAKASAVLKLPTPVTQRASCFSVGQPRQCPLA